MILINLNDFNEGIDFKSRFLSPKIQIVYDQISTRHLLIYLGLHLPVESSHRFISIRIKEISCSKGRHFLIKYQ